MDETLSSGLGTESVTERIIERFGGIRPMAAKLDMPVTTVQGWKKRGVIPAARHADILAVAAREGIELDPIELASTDAGATAGRSDIRVEDIAFGGEFAPVSPPSPRPHNSSRAASGIAVTFSVLALLATAAVAGGGWYLAVKPLQKKVAGLEQKLAAAAPEAELTRRLDVLETEIARRPAEPAASAGAVGNADIAELAQQVAQLKTGAAQTEQLAKRMGELQLAAGGRELLSQSIQDIQSSTAATQGEVERLNGVIKSMTNRLDQVDAVLSQRRQQALRAEATILAVGQLRAALRQSKPFAGEVKALRSLSGDDAQITALMDKVSAAAETGVPTRDELRANLDKLAPEIVRSTVVGDGSNWWNQALYRVQSVVSIRRVGQEVPGDKVDAIVARAGAKSDEDDLEGAIQDLQGLTGLPADIAAPWIRDAGQRVMADEVETDLTRLAIDRVAADRAQATVPSAPPAAATPTVAAPVSPVEPTQ